MLVYLIRRIAISLIVLLGLSVGVFIIVRLVPGDTVTILLGMQYTEAEAAALRQQLGLDQPVIAQYFIWLGRIVRGDLGTTIAGQPVLTEIAHALPVTLELMFTSLCFAILIGIPLGIIAAVRQNTAADHAAGLISLIGLSVPGFWLGTMLILLFSLVLGWLPSGGFVSLGHDPLANLSHMVLPGMALGAAVSAVVMRITRAALVDVIDQQYIRVARAKGVGRLRVIGQHALRNAMIPVLTIIGIQAGYLLGGSVVIEEVFSLNGLGRLILRATLSRDYQLLQAAVLFVGSCFIAINLLVDLVYVLIDPRVRLGGEA